jgi:hypothetical protein
MDCTRAGRFLSLALVVVAAAGCPGSGASQGDAGTSADRDASLARLDASHPAPGDAAIEEGLDASVRDGAPPARVLAPMHLMGDSPLDNRLLDPDLNNLALYYSWYLFSMPGFSTPPRHRLVLPRSPANLPVLEIDETGATDGVFAATYALGGRGPFTASVWLGQPAKSSKPTTLSAQVQALDGNGTDVGSTAFDLAPDNFTHQTIGDIRWTQFTAKIDTELLGWTFFVVKDASGSTLYVTGEVLVEDTDKTRMMVAPRPGRPLTPLERATLSRVVTEARKRMQSGRPHEPRQWPVPP